MKITHSILERYLDGDIDDESRRIIEAVLEKNPDKLKYLHLSADIEKAINQQNELELQGIIIDVLNKNRRKSAHKIISFKKRFKYLGVIAAILIIVFASLHILLLISNSNTGKYIYDKYYTHNNLILINRDINTNNNVNELTRLIQNNQFIEAARLSELILLVDSSNLYIRLLLSISLMETDRYNEAIIHLEKIERKKDILYSDIARWYLVLALIFIEDYDTAIIKLQMISSSGGIYANDSIDILKILCSRGYKLACQM